MLCRENLIIGFGIFLPVFFSVLFVLPSYAISDLSGDIVYDSNSTPSITAQNICTGSTCSDYHYLILTYTLGDNSTNPSFQTTLSVSSHRYNNATISNFTTEILTYPLIFNVDNFINHPNFSSLKIGSAANGTSNLSYTVHWVLTDNYNSCSCPEIPECPAIPENPYDDKLDNITMAIYCCGGILLVLYFFYCIYRVIIKSSGVDKL